MPEPDHDRFVSVYTCMFRCMHMFVHVCSRWASECACANSNCPQCACRRIERFSRRGGLYLSASSRMSQRTALNAMLSVLLMWSTSLPGVEIRMLIPFRSLNTEMTFTFCPSACRHLPASRANSISEREAPPPHTAHLIFSKIWHAQSYTATLALSFAAAVLHS